MWRWRRLSGHSADVADAPPSARELRDERLSASLDDVLTAEELAALDAELAADPDLRADLDGLRQVTSLLASLEIERAPRSFALAAPPPAGSAARARFGRLELLVRAGAATAVVAFVVVLAGDLAGSRTATPVLDQPSAAEEQLAMAESAETLVTGALANGAKAASAPADGARAIAPGGAGGAEAGGSMPAPDESGAAQSAPSPPSLAPAETPMSGMAPPATTPPATTMGGEDTPAVTTPGFGALNDPAADPETPPEPAVSAPPVADTGAGDVATSSALATPAPLTGLGGGAGSYGGRGGADFGGVPPRAGVMPPGAGVSSFQGGEVARYTVTTSVDVDALLIVEVTLGALAISLILAVLVLRSAGRREP